MKVRLLAGVAVFVAVCGLLTAVADPLAAAPGLDPKPVRVYGGSGHGGLYGWGATTLVDGSVLVGDYWNTRVHRFAADGTYLGVFIDNAGLAANQHYAPYGLAADPNTGHVYMADTDRYTIDKYDQLGNFVKEWGSQGTGTGRFRYPSRVAVGADSRVYIADTWENHIVVDDANGNELFTFGETGSGNGQMKQPHGMAFDAQNRLWVVDAGNKRIQVFDAEGTFLFAFGSQGTDPGQFAGDIRGIAIDKANGWVYVVDGEGNRVHKFDTDGNFLHRWGSNGSGPGQFHDGGREVTVDGEGDVWVGDMPNFRVQEFSPSGVFKSSALPPPHIKEPPPGGFNAPRGVAVDAAGNLFVTDTYNWRITKLDSDGNHVVSWGRRGRGPYEFNYPRLLAVDPTDQGVIVADTDNHDVKKYTNDGVFVWERGGLGSLPGQFRNPHGVDVDQNGRVLVTDTNNDRIQVLNNDGTPALAFGSSGQGNGQMLYPRGIAADPVDNSIWVADSNRDIVLHFSDDGDYLGSLGAKGLADNQLDAPFDVEVDTDYLYIADTSRHKIKVFTRAGGFVRAIGSPGPTLGRFRQPEGMDLAPGGRLFVAEETNERVQEIALGGGSFAVDTTRADSAVTVPTVNQVFPVGEPITFTGTATDNKAVGTVKLAIRNNTTKLWWRGGTTWGSSKTYLTQTTSAAATSTGWAWTWMPPGPGTYSLQVTAVDTAGNTDSSRPFVKFSVS